MDLEPHFRPLFLIRSSPTKQGLDSNQNKGHLGSRENMDSFASNDVCLLSLERHDPYCRNHGTTKNPSLEDPTIWITGLCFWNILTWKGILHISNLYIEMKN